MSNCQSPNVFQLINTTYETECPSGTQYYLWYLSTAVESMRRRTNDEYVNTDDKYGNTDDDYSNTEDKYGNVEKYF